MARRKVTKAQILKAKERRAELIDLSNKAKQGFELCSPSLDGYTGNGSVNSLVMFLFYPEGKYNTGGGWRKENKFIKKGSKGFAIWGKPRKFTKKADKKTEEKDTEYKAFPVAYLFHESQVQEFDKPSLKEVA